MVVKEADGRSVSGESDTVRQVKHILLALQSRGLDVESTFAAAVGAQWPQSAERAALCGEGRPRKATLRAFDAVHAHFGLGLTDREVADRLMCAATTAMAARYDAVSALPTSVGAALPDEFARAISYLKSNPGAPAQDIATFVGFASTALLRAMFGNALWGLVTDSDKNDHAAQAARQRYSDTDIFEGLREVLAHSGAPHLSTTDYEKYRESSPEIKSRLASEPLISKRFGSWLNACRLAGVAPEQSTNRRVYPSRWSPEQIDRVMAEFILTSGGTNAINNFDTWAVGKDAPKSIRMSASPRKWREIVAAGFELIRNDAQLRDRYEARVDELAAAVLRGEADRGAGVVPKAA